MKVSCFGARNDIVTPCYLFSFNNVVPASILSRMSIWFWGKVNETIQSVIDAAFVDEPLSRETVKAKWRDSHWRHLETMLFIVDY